MIYIIFVFLSLLNARLIDDFSDGNITLDPTWYGDLGAFTVSTNSTSGTNSSGSYSLRLNAPPDGSVSQFISMSPDSWSGTVEWGAWVGRRSGSTFTTSNKVRFYLWSSSSDLESENLNGYRIEIGDNSGNDEIRLIRVDNGTPIIILEGAVPLDNGISDISFLLRVTRTANGTFTIYTSEAPTSGVGPSSTLAPSSDNTNVFQGTIEDDTYDTAVGGYLGFQIIHTSSATARSSVEIDQIWFETFSDQSLPVFLSSFEASEGFDCVSLQWITESELDNLGFELEKITGGQKQIIASYLNNANLAGAGSTTERNYYNYHDRALPTSKALYKLYQIDFSGMKSLVGKVEFKRVNNLTDTGIVFPNPSSGTVKIKLETLGGIGKLQVFNLLGQELFSSPVFSNSNENTVTIHFKNILSPGMYFARISGKNYSQTQRFVLKP